MRLKIIFIPLKTKLLSPFLYLILALLLVSFSDPYTIKRISDLNFRYEFYTTEKKVNPKENKTYYWFKGGLIHNSQAGIAGDLLDDTFVKMYHSNQLAEKGKFKKGLKTGIWKSWHPNGRIQTTQHWRNGMKIGLFYHYDENGTIAEKGYYRRDKKQGNWIDYVKKDTLTYRNGALVDPKKPKLSKLDKFKLEQQSSKKEQSNKELQQAEELRDATALASLKASAKENRKTLKENSRTAKQIKKAENVSKENSKLKAFFKNLFNKEQSKQKKNGKGA